VEKLIITAAIIGNITSRDKNPHVPILPREIAESAIESYKAGAAICHIHVRDPKTQEQSMKLELYQEVVDRVRDKCDMIINLTTGSGARLTYDENAKDNPWNTSLLKSPEERVDHVLRLRPEICSLDVGSLNFGPRVFVNLVPHVERMARMIKEVGTKVELEVFDVGHINIAKHLIRKGLIENPPVFQLCMGIPWGIEATPENLIHMYSSLPENAIWFGFGVGHAEFPIVTFSMLLGGHARVGFEDNIFISHGILAKSNGQFVEKIIQIAKLFDRDIADVKESRRILGIG
jgi:uncharacterized protein (DUF849 family)